jgi:predicted Zn-dependent protease
MISGTHVIVPFYKVFLPIFLYYTIAVSWEREIEIHRQDIAAVDATVHEAIETANVLLSAPELEQHIAVMMTLITGTLPGTVPPYRIKVINSSEINAFSLSDGTIYISLGMFGLVDNDAQLAWLLAHEISHVNLNHHRLFRYELHKRTAQNLLPFDNTSFNLRTALSGFSIAQERAADSSALSIIISRGYNAWTGKNILYTMYTWLKYKEKDYDSTNATHPQLSERYKTSRNRLKTINFDTTSGIIGDSSYQAAINNYQYKIIGLLRESNSVNELYAMTKAKIRKNGSIPDWHYLRGSLMERFYPVDSFFIAQTELSTALKLDPSFTIGLRDLGWLFLKNKQYDSARTYLSQYLVHNPQAPDSSLILYYLESISE